MENRGIACAICEKTDEETVLMKVDDSLDACDCISDVLDDLVDNLKDICSKVKDHPNREILQAVMRRAGSKIDQVYLLKLDLFDDVNLMKKILHEEAA